MFFLWLTNVCVDRPFIATHTDVCVYKRVYNSLTCIVPLWYYLTVGNDNCTRHLRFSARTIQTTEYFLSYAPFNNNPNTFLYSSMLCSDFQREIFRVITLSLNRTKKLWVFISRMRTSDIFFFFVLIIW